MMRSRLRLKSTSLAPAALAISRWAGRTMWPANTSGGRADSHEASSWRLASGRAAVMFAILVTSMSPTECDSLFSGLSRAMNRACSQVACDGGMEGEAGWVAVGSSYKRMDSWLLNVRF